MIILFGSIIGAIFHLFGLLATFTEQITMIKVYIWLQTIMIIYLVLQFLWCPTCWWQMIALAIATITIVATFIDALMEKSNINDCNLIVHL